MSLKLIRINKRVSPILPYVFVTKKILISFLGCRYATDQSKQHKQQEEEKNNLTTCGILDIRRYL